MVLNCSTVMNLKKIFSIVIIQLSIFNYSFAQDPQFTQSFGAMTYNNPAFSGKDTMGTVFITHRNQWPKLSGTYQTTVVGWQQYIGKLNSYSGFHVMTDKAGAFTTTRITFNYAQNIKIKKLLLRPVFEAAYFQKSVDWNKLSFGDQIDPRTGFAFTTSDRARCGSATSIDFNIGLLASYSNFNLGISVHHITQPNESLLCGNSPLPMKIGFQIGYSLNIPFGPGPLKLDPYYMYFTQGNFQMTQYGLNIIYKNILFGVSSRRQDAIAFLGGFKHERFTIAYSYDITTSSLTNESTGGSHEFSLAIRFWKRKAHKKFLEKYSGFY